VGPAELQETLRRVLQYVFNTSKRLVHIAVCGCVGVWVCVCVCVCLFVGVFVCYGMTLEIWNRLKH
jgi:hypothetical protein